MIDLAPAAEPVHVVLRGAAPELVNEALSAVGAGSSRRTRCRRTLAVSIWAGDAARAERLARTLPNRQVMIGRYRPTPMPPAERLQRHVSARQLEYRAPWAPQLPQTARFQTALAELRFGREARRWPALRALVRGSGEGRRPSEQPASPLAHTPHGPRVPVRHSPSAARGEATTRCRS